MDELIIYFVLFVVYMIFQAIGAKNKKKKRPQPQAPPPGQRPKPQATAPGSQPAADPSLDDALREIRIALGMETPTEVPPPPRPVAETLPKPPPKPRPKPKPKRTEPARPPGWGSEFIPHEQHFSDAEFEALRGDAEGFRDEHYERPAPLQTYTLPTAAPGIPPERVKQALRSPERAREAFVLGEIFGPPRALKRR